LVQCPQWASPRTEESTGRALALLRDQDVLELSPGERFEAFVHLVRGDTRARSIVLLGDPSPAVRAYAAECLLSEHPEEADCVYALLGDRTRILVKRYGGGDFSTVGEMVLRNLRMARNAAAAAGAAFERAIAEGFAKR
jgi:hypothetical protein